MDAHVMSVQISFRIELSVNLRHRLAIISPLIRVNQHWLHVIPKFGFKSLDIYLPLDSESVKLDPLSAPSCLESLLVLNPKHVLNILHTRRISLVVSQKVKFVSFVFKSYFNLVKWTISILMKRVMRCIVEYIALLIHYNLFWFSLHCFYWFLLVEVLDLQLPTKQLSQSF